jgi:neutral amino acid transport system permease protein
VILGGAGTVWGPIIGAVIFQFLFFSLDTLMQQVQAEVGWINALISSTGAAQMRVVFLGIGIMLLLTFRPQGLFGNREEALFGD